METRQKRINYRILNDGSDEEADPEDRILSDDYPTAISESFPENQSFNLQTTVDPLELSLSSSIAPSESISQLQSSQHSSQPQKKARLEQSSWL
jgi:hypothetical protein